MQIKFWQTKAGRFPVLEFIEDQPDEDSARIMKGIDHFSKQGLSLLSNPDKMKKFTGYDHLYELKVDFKGVFYRIILCVSRGIAHLLVAFKKKGNQTPRAHLKTALTRQQTITI
jgi:phage-related protein